MTDLLDPFGHRPWPKWYTPSKHRPKLRDMLSILGDSPDEQVLRDLLFEVGT